MISLLLPGLPWCLNGKKFACHCRRCGFDPWVRKIPWRRKWQPTLVFLPRKYHVQRIWWAAAHGVAKESDATQWLHNSNCCSLASRAQEHLLPPHSPVAKWTMSSESAKQKPEPSVVLISLIMCFAGWGWGVLCFVLGNHETHATLRLRERSQEGDLDSWHIPFPISLMEQTFFMSSHGWDSSKAPASCARENILCPKHRGMFFLPFLFGIFGIFLLLLLQIHSSTDSWLSL